MALAFVKCTKIENASGATASGTVTYTAGNCLLCPTGAFNRSGNLAVSDGTNTYTTDVQTAVASGNNSGIASTPSLSGSSVTYSATWTGSAACVSFPHEFSGQATSSINDAVGAHNASNVATTTTSPLSNVQAAVVFIAHTSNDANGTIAYASTGSGWTMDANGHENDGAGVYANASAYQIVSSVASQTETWSGSVNSNWTTSIATYKASGGAAPTPIRPPMRTLRGAGL